MASLSHQDLKKNELADILYAVMEWIKNNRQTFYSIVGIAAGIILFTVFVLTQYYSVRMRVSDKLSIAQALIYHNQVDQGLALLNEVISQYSSSPAASMARLTKAEYLISQRKYKEAKDMTAYVMGNGKPAAVVPLAYPYMGNIQEDMQDYQGAISTYNEFLTKFPEHFLLPKILESLGRVYELSGANEQAKTIYQRLSTEYKGAKWEQNALERLFFLNNPKLKKSR